VRVMHILQNSTILFICLIGMLFGIIALNDGSAMTEQQQYYARWSMLLGWFLIGMKTLEVLLLRLGSKGCQ
jgi:hypothetical protein